MSDTENIFVIGSPSVGKTTYLATLLYHFDPTQPIKYNRLGITAEAIGADTEQLKEDVKIFLKARESLQSTPPNLENYKFLLRIPSKLLGQLKDKEITFDVIDVAGEVFKKLDFEVIPSEAQEHIQQCSKAKKWLLLLNDWEPSADQTSKRRLERLFKEVEPEVKTSLQVAVVMSKCERGELWSGRKEPKEDIFAVHLPETYLMLKHCFRDRPHALEFFACSSFGVLGEKLHLPNRVPPSGATDDPHRKAVIRNIDAWKPYGLITPIVWLDTSISWRWKHI